MTDVPLCNAAASLPVLSEFTASYLLQRDKLRRLLNSIRGFDSAIELALDIHAITHTSAVSPGGTSTFCDSLLNGLAKEDYSVPSAETGETIAWQLWHLARIEDLVGNLLIAEQSQVFDDDWMTRLNVTIRDTGNAMTDPEIIDFSKRVNVEELIRYRDAVGLQTCVILKSLTPPDLKRRPGADALARLVSEGGLLECKKSLWLRDFWGKYTVAGLILLPLTRHHILHLPDGMAIKSQIYST